MRVRENVAREVVADHDRHEREPCAAGRGNTRLRRQRTSSRRAGSPRRESRASAQGCRCAARTGSGSHRDSQTPSLGIRARRLRISCKPVPVLAAHGIPLLMPSILGAVILLFGNSFAAYATAYSLHERDRAPARADHDRQRPLGRRSLEPHEGQALAFGMFVVSAAMMLFYIPLQRRGHGGPSETGRESLLRPSCGSLGAAYFLIPLIATLLFSLKDEQTGKCAASPPTARSS